MGIQFDEEMISEFPDWLIKDLAGNAFDASSFLAVWMTLLCLLARMAEGPLHNV
jgi:hypothetical protein